MNNYIGLIIFPSHDFQHAWCTFQVSTLKLNVTFRSLSGTKNLIYTFSQRQCSYIVQIVSFRFYLHGNANRNLMSMSVRAIVHNLIKLTMKKTKHIWFGLMVYGQQGRSILVTHNFKVLISHSGPGGIASEAQL